KPEGPAVRNRRTEYLTDSDQTQSTKSSDPLDEISGRRVCSVSVRRAKNRSGADWLGARKPLETRGRGAVPPGRADDQWRYGILNPVTRNTAICARVTGSSGQ